MAYIGSHITRLINSGLIEDYKYIDDDTFEFKVNFFIDLDVYGSPICYHYRSYNLGDSDFKSYNAISKTRIDALVYKIRCTVYTASEMVKNLCCDMYAIKGDDIVPLPTQIISASDTIYLVDIFDKDAGFLLPYVVTSEGKTYSALINDEIENWCNYLSIFYGEHENLCSNERLDMIFKGKKIKIKKD